MKELNKCYLIDNKYIIINYTSSKKIKYDRQHNKEWEKEEWAKGKLHYLSYK